VEVLVGGNKERVRTFSPVILKFRENVMPDSKKLLKCPG
jgi:hypothetical protein